MSNFMKRIRSKVWKNGLTRTFQQFISVMEDYCFDLKHGIDTSEIVQVEDLDITREDKKHSRRYQPTRIRYIKKLIRELKLPEGSVFVDFGSGKGRVLFVASNYNFKRVVGVEISSKLCEIARNNLVVYERKLKRPLKVEIVESNVLRYDIRDDENIFYFFRPFDGLIMEKIIEKIISSLKESPRKVWVIICSSIFDDLFEGKQIFQRSMGYAYGGAEFVVYVNH